MKNSDIEINAKSPETLTQGQDASDAIRRQDWQAVTYDAIRACRQGRALLIEHFGRLKHVQEKPNAGLVSEADQASEEAIKKYLLSHFPQSEFLGEETHFREQKDYQKPSTKEGRWILDPLDGTTNYVHRFPVFCISLALEVEGVIQLGVIDVPMFGETYVAIRGQGAFINGKRISVSQTAFLKDSLLATGFFPEDEEALSEQLNYFSKIVRICHGVRRAGAAAYDLCMVAQGSFDAFWEKNLKPWDVAAGILLVQEAGGLCIDYSGQESSPYDHSIIAGNPKVVPQILEKFKQ